MYNQKIEGNYIVSKLTTFLDHFYFHLGILGLQNTLPNLLRHGDGDAPNDEKVDRRGEKGPMHHPYHGRQEGTRAGKLWQILQTLPGSAKYGRTLNKRVY